MDISLIIDNGRTWPEIRELDEFVVYDWADRPLRSTIDDLTDALRVSGPG